MGMPSPFAYAQVNGYRIRPPVPPFTTELTKPITKKHNDNYYDFQL